MQMLQKKDKDSIFIVATYLLFIIPILYLIITDFLYSQSRSDIFYTFTILFVIFLNVATKSTLRLKYADYARYLCNFLYFGYAMFYIYKISLI